jgi:hypothetical protein
MFQGSGFKVECLEVIDAAYWGSGIRRYLHLSFRSCMRGRLPAARFRLRVKR